MMSVDYLLAPEDVASARLLALGIRPRVEVTLFAACVVALLAWSVSPWSFSMLPLLIGLTASLGAFRLMQIGRVREASLTAYRRNPTLRQQSIAAWDDRGVTISPAASASEHILWAQLRPLKENERIVLLLQRNGSIHAIPKRAFADRAALAALRGLAKKATRLA